MSYRSLNFRDYVLNPICYKIGLDPRTNFEDSQARAIGTYVNEYVRKSWFSNDWPEWTFFVAAIPDANHVVPYDYALTLNDIPSLVPNTATIGRVLSVNIMDPRTTDVPVSTTFTERENGIHCGYDHGSYVWIEFMPPPPVFTAELWDAARTYNRGESIYVPATGECYASLLDGNVNNDPLTTPEQPIPHKVIRDFVAGTGGGPGQNELYSIPMLPPGPFESVPVNGTIFTAYIYDINGNSISSQVITANGVKTVTELLADMVTALTADGLLAAFTFTSNTTQLAVSMSAAQVFSGFMTYVVPSHAAIFIQGKQIQPYLASSPSSPPVGQRIQITVSPSDVIPGSIYTLRYVDVMGVIHEVSYTASGQDGAGDIVTGLSNAIEVAGDTDPSMADLITNVDLTNGLLNIGLPTLGGINLTQKLAGTVWWQIVPFPFELVDACVRGATAEVLIEWGQLQPGMAAQQTVPQEVSNRVSITADQQYSPQGPKTANAGGRSRYLQ